MNHPSPPESLDGEQILEWQRVVAELEANNQLDKADRVVLTLYVQTWAIHQNAMRHVDRHGAVVKYPNGVVGQSPHYKTATETLKSLIVLLKEMGLTYSTRPRAKAPENEALEF